jgi:histidinol-phosphate/aromatic aminotransferase/cobyric acid decarboxylase-like protein
MLDLARDAGGLERHLFEQGVIVRPMGGYGLPQTVRISIGSHVENERLLRAIENAAIEDRTVLPSPARGRRWREPPDEGK